LPGGPSRVWIDSNIDLPLRSRARDLEILKARALDLGRLNARFAPNPNGDYSRTIRRTVVTQEQRIFESPHI